MRKNKKLIQMRKSVKYRFAVRFLVRRVCMLAAGCVAVRVRQEETSGRCNFRHVIHSPLPRSRESNPAAAVQLVCRIIDPLMTSRSVVGECRDQTLFRSRMQFMESKTIE